MQEQWNLLSPSGLEDCITSKSTTKTKLEFKTIPLSWALNTAANSSSKTEGFKLYTDEYQTWANPSQVLQCHNSTIPLAQLYWRNQYDIQAESHLHAYIYLF
ncbi:hypothetical protein L798_11047 [Zootermopsis nevadensis]|uniref:Uncharacterized protein n=1 Tax=Zootermopsis nevadensis TaxID=136037 RepID=A0A067RJ08_ZOONE|nr:hypothetical protein L798_11047 [Zootermopsis nevadensis]